MKSFLRKTYVYISLCLDFLFKRRNFGAFLGSYFLIILILTGSLLFNISGSLVEVIGLVLKFEIFLMCIYYILVLPRQNWFRKRGDINNFETLSKFNHSSFFKGLFWISFLIAGYWAVLVAQSFNFFWPLYFVISSLYIFIWFSSHIVFETTPYSKIRERIHLYLALIATLTFISTFYFKVNFFEEVFLAYGVSFAWISYLLVEDAETNR